MCDKLFVIFWLLFGSSALTAGFKNMVSSEDKFQNALEKQTFQSILTSIAERLKNLDNTYSIQLSQTLASKLESYHRKIDSLDAKIVRLESLMMMNLEKISDNISTKNYKDDVVKTNTFRRLDFLYEGINHRLNYVDRKNDAAYGKIQEKLDLLMIKLDRMEENMGQRSLDMEVELSEAFQFTEDFETTAVNVENLINMTSKILNKLSNQDLDNNNISEARKHDEINKKLTKLENLNQETINITLSSENLLKEIKKTLSDDLNAYANKVADMNSYFWNNHETIEKNIKSLEGSVSSTRIELKNGIRALIVQVGKKHGDEPTVNDKTIESIKTDVKEVLSSQNLFLESCYKVQSDEAQIESEISETLEKLIDIFEEKMKSAMKDIKNLEKSVKSHDQRMARIITQTNSNVITLFEKTVRGDENIVTDVADIKTTLTSMFDNVKQLLFEAKEDMTISKDAINHIVNIISELSLKSYMWTTKEDLDRNAQKVINEFLPEVRKLSVLLKSDTSTISQVTKNVTDKVEYLSVNFTVFQNFLNNSLQSILQTLYNKTNNYTIKNDTVKNSEKLIGDTKDLTEMTTTEKTVTTCSQQYSHLIDIRGDLPNICAEETEEKTGSTFTTPEIHIDKLVTEADTTSTSQSNTISSSNIQNNCTQDYSNLIDMRGDITNPCNEIKTTESSSITKVKDTSKASPEISTETSISEFGPTYGSKTKRNCTQQYSDLIDIRGDLCTEQETNEALVVEPKPFEKDDELHQAILDIFGTDPPPSATTENEVTKNNEVVTVPLTEDEEFQTTKDTVYPIDLRHDPD